MENVLQLAEKMDRWWSLGAVDTDLGDAVNRTVIQGLLVLSIILSVIIVYPLLVDSPVLLSPWLLLAVFAFVAAGACLFRPALARWLMVLGFVLLSIALAWHLPLYRGWFAPLLGMGAFALLSFGLIPALLLLWSVLLIQTGLSVYGGSVSLSQQIASLMTQGAVTTVLTLLFAFLSDRAKSGLERSLDAIDLAMLSDQRQKALLKGLTLEASAVVGNLELFRETGNTGRQELLELAQSGRHLLAVIDGMSSVVGAGTMDTDQDKSFIPKSLFLDLERMLRPIFVERGLALSVDHDGLSPQPYSAKGVDLFKILFGVISDVFATGDGARSISVTGRIQRPTDDSHTLRVDLEYDQSRTDAASMLELWILLDEPDGLDRIRRVGFGRGLALSAQLMKKAGTVVQAEDLADGGLRVSLLFAVSPVELEPDPSAVAVSPQWDAESVRNLLQHVLLVEDDSTQRRVMADMLRKLGAQEIDLASTGREALELLTPAAPPSLLFTDFLMPDMTGLQLVQKIRAQVSSGVPVIMCTSVSGQTDVEGFQRAGVEAVVIKPLSPARLQQAIGDVVNAGVVAGASPEDPPDE